MGGSCFFYRERQLYNKTRESSRWHLGFTKYYVENDEGCQQSGTAIQYEDKSEKNSIAVTTNLRIALVQAVIRSLKQQIWQSTIFDVSNLDPLNQILDKS